MDRKKILIVGDSAKLHTGFASVIREVWTVLNRTGKYDIRQIGWFHQETNEEVTWPIIQTEKDSDGRITQVDKYAHKSFASQVEKFKPDVVWSIGDQWMVDHIANSPNRKTFKWIMYSPIDGHPSPSKWGQTFDNADVAVLYGQYGIDVIKQRAPKANMTYIYHGVDSKAFKPLPEAEKKAARDGILNIKDNRILIGTVGRNQPRKAFDKLFEAYFYIYNGHYIQCKDCEKISVFNYDLITRRVSPIKQCRHCRGNNVKLGSRREDVYLYAHAPVVDCGWDLMDLQTDYNLHGRVLVNPILKIGVGVPEYVLNGVYNCFDIFTLPTRGEGFGLPILEAMSCGIPIVVTDYSAHTEWSREAGHLVPPITLESEPLTNIRRAIIDMDLYVTALMDLVNNPDKRKAFGDAGREQAEKMDWEIIIKQWETLIDSILYPNGDMPTIQDPSQVTYTLESV